MRRREHAFTLIEMIVATVLLFVGVTATLMALAAAQVSTAISNEYSTAALLAEQRFGEIATNPQSELTAGDHEGEFGEEHPTFSYTQSVTPADVDGLLRVSITIKWRSGARERFAEFTSYEAEPEEEGA